MATASTTSKARDIRTTTESPAACHLESRAVKVGDIDIRYLSGGQGDPLVIIHGCGDGAEAWLPAARELAKHYTVYIPDLPGFGYSQSLRGSCHVSDFVSFVDDFSRSLYLNRFHLLGHSSGGSIALLYALRFPHRIKKLTLVSSIGLGEGVALWVRVLSSPVFTRTIGEAVIAILKAAGWLSGLLHAPLRFVNPLPRARMALGVSTTTLKGQNTVLLGHVSELTMPTLLVWGSNDSIVPVSHAYATARLIPCCQLHVFEGTGHKVHRDKSEELCQLLVRFFNQDFPT